MAAKEQDSKLNIGFTTKIWSQTASYPYILIKEYSRLGIDEKALVTLLRILHPFFSTGELTLEAVAREFSVTAEEARSILLPFVDKRLLEESRDKQNYTINGVLNCFYEDWIAGERNPREAAAERPLLGGSLGRRERQLLHDLSRLFRGFEQELGKNLTPMQSEEIRSWLEQDHLPADMIEEALRRAVMQEKRSFAYIKSILRKWREAGYSDLSSVMENDRKPDDRSGRSNKKAAAGGGKKSKYHEIYDKY